MLDASFLASCACALAVDYCWVFDAAYWLLVRPVPGMCPGCGRLVIFVLSGGFCFG